MINMSTPRSNYRCAQVRFHLNVRWRAQPTNHSGMERALSENNSRSAVD